MNHGYRSPNEPVTEFQTWVNSDEGNDYYILSSTGDHINNGGTHFKLKIRPFLYLNQEVYIPLKTRKQNGSNNAWIMDIVK